MIFRRRRARVPTILQMEMVECGAAALAMVLAYYGKFVSLEELRLACGVSRDGSKASNMVRAARRYGMRARGYKLDLPALRRMPLPMILHWNFNHFVVLEGFGRNGRAYVNDPAFGRRVVTAQELDQSFTGVGLTLRPGPEFEPGGARSGIVAGLRARFGRAHGAILFAVLASLALAVPGIAVPGLSRIFVDEILLGGVREWTRPVLLALAVSTGAIVVVTALQRRSLLRLETRLALANSSRFLWHVLHLPMEFFAQRFPGEIGSRVAINDRIAQLLSGELAAAVLGAFVVSIYAALMIRYDAYMAGIVVAAAAVNIAALRYMARSRTDFSQRLMHERGKLLGTAMGGLMNIESIKATASEPDFFARWAGYYAKVVNAKQQIGRQTQLLAAVAPLATALGSALVLGQGGLRVVDGQMTMGMLVAFHGLMLAFFAPLTQLVTLTATVGEVQADMRRLDDVMGMRARQANDDREDDLQPVPKLTGRLELSRVSFGYSRMEPPLIRDFTLSLRPGARVALVGASGSGKSTIARLVAGLYEPWTGEIRLDGKPRARVPRRTLQNSISVVDQEPFLFEGTVRENLTMWDDTVEDADVIRAARDACIHDDIMARPGGYSALVEEDGRNFSAGQRQRLEIARALVNNPTILVLDEATSALDSTTELRVAENLCRRGCTCLIVAHRLSTIRDCDEIIVLERGRIVQRGTHDELMREEGTYRRLIRVG